MRGDAVFQVEISRNTKFFSYPSWILLVELRLKPPTLGGYSFSCRPCTLRSQSPSSLTALLGKQHKAPETVGPRYLCVSIHRPLPPTYEWSG